MKVPSHIKWEITEPSRSEHNQAELSQAEPSKALHLNLSLLSKDCFFASLLRTWFSYY